MGQLTFRQVGQPVVSNALSVLRTVTRWRPGLMLLAMMLSKLPLVFLSRAQ